MGSRTPTRCRRADRLRAQTGITGSQIDRHELEHRSHFWIIMKLLLIRPAQAASGLWPWFRVLKGQETCVAVGSLVGNWFSYIGNEVQKVIGKDLLVPLRDKNNGFKFT